VAAGSLTLQLLGSGGAFSRRFGTTCAVLTLPDGNRWLLDCGRQAPDQLEKAKLSWHDIAGQLITHVHGDHVYGLEDFSFSRYYVSGATIPAIIEGGPRPQMIVHTGVRKELWDFLAPSLRYLMGSNGDPCSGTLEHYFEIQAPLRAEEPRHGRAWPHAETFDCGGLEIVMRETPHIPGKPACAIEFWLPGHEANSDDPRMAWWSGDSVVEPRRLPEIAERASIMFHDCTFVPASGFVHGLFDQLRRLPAATREKIVLMHHEDDLDDHEAIALAQGFRIARPGDTFDLITGERLITPAKAS
jgi:ribonuclease BN (tRNA processing enzyme)